MATTNDGKALFDVEKTLVGDVAGRDRHSLGPRIDDTVLDDDGLAPAAGNKTYEGVR